MVERLNVATVDLDGVATRQRTAEHQQVAAHTAADSVARRILAEVHTPARRLVESLNVLSSRVRDVAGTLSRAAGIVEFSKTPAAADDIDVDGDLPTLATLCDAAVAVNDDVLSVAADIERRSTEIQRGAELELATLLAGVDCADINDLHRSHGGAQVTVDAADRRVEEASTAVTQAADLDRVLVVAVPFVANLDVLSAALQNQHFLAHLVHAREADLLTEATRRLKLITDGRFGFVTDFGVIDIYSGEIRTADTLSGGERFQASLALALGLIEIASRGGGRLDAVFVDEGFGSLDSNALDVALDTLGKIAGAGKMVALISHLRPVADYVETVLHVTKDDMFGSRIKVLDADAREQLLADDIRSGLMS